MSRDRRTLIIDSCAIVSDCIFASAVYVPQERRREGGLGGIGRRQSNHEISDLSFTSYFLCKFFYV